MAHLRTVNVPQAAGLLEDEAEDVRAYVHFRRGAMALAHSIHMLESINKEVRGRTLVVRIFQPGLAGADGGDPL